MLQTIGQVIKKLRKERRMTQEELALNLNFLSFDSLVDCIDAAKKELAALDLIYYDGNKMCADNLYINVRAGLAYNLAKSEEYDEALGQLAILADEMIAADSLPLIQ